MFFLFYFLLVPIRVYADFNNNLKCFVKKEKIQIVDKIVKFMSKNTDF